MSVTLEQCILLRERHTLGRQHFSTALDCMRRSVSWFSSPSCFFLSLKSSGVLFSLFHVVGLTFSFSCFTPLWNLLSIFILLYTTLLSPSLPPSFLLLLAPPDLVCPGGKYLAVILIPASLHVGLSQGIGASGCHSVWLSRLPGATCTLWRSSWCPLTCWSCGSS